MRDSELREDLGEYRARWTLTALHPTPGHLFRGTSPRVPTHATQDHSAGQVPSPHQVLTLALDHLPNPLEH